MLENLVLKKISKILFVSLAIILFTLSILKPDLVNYFSLIIFIIVSIPALADYLKRLEILGTEIEFKNEINKTDDLIKKSIKKAKEKTKNYNKSSKFETFDLSLPKLLFKDDPNLALSILRSEIENKLRKANQKMNLIEKREINLKSILKELRKQDVLFPEQVGALKRIINMCNKVIHGFSVSKDEAKEIIDLAEKLNKSFSLGYSINFEPNYNYMEEGNICEWQHCIERMPLRIERNEKSCPIFGHDCPGGVKRAKICKELDKKFKKELESKNG